MKKLIMALVAVAFVSPALAADKKDNHETKETTTHNPITGSTTTTTESKVVAKDESGEGTMKVKHKKKIKKDGTVQEETKVKGKTESETH